MRISSAARSMRPTWVCWGGESADSRSKLAGRDDDHERSAQFVTDIAGEEAFPVQGLAELPKGGVEGRGQMDDFVVGELLGQDVGTGPVRALHATGEAGDWLHDPRGHEFAQYP